MKSIRRSLLWTLLPAVLLLLAIAALAVIHEVRDEIGELFDAQLVRAANVVPGAVSPEPLARDDDEDDPSREIVIEARTNGAAAPTYYSPLHVPLPPAQELGFTAAQIRGEEWRIYSRRVGQSTIQVAQPLRVRNDASDEIASRIALPILLLVPAVIITVLLLLKRGLRPLTKFAQELDTRSAEALESVPVATLPAELLPMATAMNELLSRLESALKTQKVFIADAAHELLTPLTALQVQVQMLERAKSPERRAQATQDVREGLERCITLARQLLTLARHSVEHPPDHKDVIELGTAVRAAMAEVLPKAHERSIDLGIAHESACCVYADVKAIQILLSNLLDNAIKYSPSGGRVDVAIDVSGGKPVVAISDTGPGIAESEQARVFDRFYRSNTVDADGSGLGLAIAREIALRHDAFIELRTPGQLGGLDVSVVFACEARRVESTEVGITEE